jgi:hypothetical protein
METEINIVAPFQHRRAIKRDARVPRQPPRARACAVGSALLHAATLRGAALDRVWPYALAVKPARYGRGSNAARGDTGRRCHRRAPCSTLARPQWPSSHAAVHCAAALGTPRLPVHRAPRQRWRAEDSGGASATGRRRKQNREHWGRGAVRRIEKSTSHVLRHCGSRGSATAVAVLACAVNPLCVLPLPGRRFKRAPPRPCGHAAAARSAAREAVTTSTDGTYHGCDILARGGDGSRRLFASNGRRSVPRPTHRSRT